MSGADGECGKKYVANLTTRQVRKKGTARGQTDKEKENKVKIVTKKVMRPRVTLALWHSIKKGWAIARISG